MKIAITGGIGSGKSYVCQRLQARNIEVYDCDAAAKRLMCTSVELQNKLQQLVGEGLYIKGVLQKPLLAKFLLASEENAKAVNEIVHPAVAHDFEQSGKDWIESAIYFDSGFNKRISIDKVVCITAPIATRIARVMHRDGISREKTLEWIARQLPQEDVRRLSDFEIVNDGIRDIDSQIDAFLQCIDISSEGKNNEIQQ
ncbi:MAG: dephospho-CoA kinase [Prevotella sp.]|nr:dephospho-CoA kinase [Prevotella sp.]